jgi:hypothetical protein
MGGGEVRFMDALFDEDQLLSEGIRPTITAGREQDQRHSSGENAVTRQAHQLGLAWLPILDASGLLRLARIATGEADAPRPS